MSLRWSRQVEEGRFVYDLNDGTLWSVGFVISSRGATEGMQHSDGVLGEVILH